MSTSSTPDRAALRSRNLRLGLILASVAVVFFIGFIAKMSLFRA